MCAPSQPVPGTVEVMHGAANTAQPLIGEGWECAEPEPEKR